MFLKHFLSQASQQPLPHHCCSRSIVYNSRLTVWRFNNATRGRSVSEFTYLCRYTRASIISLRNWYRLRVIGSFSCRIFRLLGDEVAGVTNILKATRERRKWLFAYSIQNCTTPSASRGQLFSNVVSPTRWNELSSPSFSHLSVKHIVLFSGQVKAFRLLSTRLTGSRHILSKLLRPPAFICKQSSCDIFRTRTSSFAFPSWRVSCDKNWRPQKRGYMTKDSAHRS